MKLIYFAEESWEEAYLAAKLPGIAISSVVGPIQNHPELSDPDADMLSVFVNSQVGSAEMDRFPGLRLIATRSTGFDHIDLAEAQKRGIVVASVPSYGVNTVAEFAFALLLTLSRKLLQASARLKEGSFDQHGLTGFDLAGKTLGVVGSGRIGAHTIKIAKGFGMGVVAYDAFPNTELASTLGFTYKPLPDLLATSDVISLHAPYMKETHHLMNTETFSNVKKGAMLINTARGALVDSEALLKALNDGTLSGAGLDVLEKESDMNDPTNKALISHPNVLVTPHVAFDTTEAIKRILDTTVENILGFANGSPTNLVKS